MMQRKIRKHNKIRQKALETWKLVCKMVDITFEELFIILLKKKEKACEG